MAAVAPPLAHRFRQHLRRTGLVSPGKRVLVALSGGLDSVVLLHLLAFRLTDWKLQLAAAHFDHRMRDGSAADANWTAGLCLAWQVPLERGAAADPPRAEAEAREARYAFVLSAARRFGADAVATGHHADDQAETVLFRLIRGTGLRGLAGIPARRGRIVRPLLPFTRAELHRYAGEAGLRYRTDPTNLTLEYARNRLRHQVLPLLESIAPGARDALLRAVRDARDAETALEFALQRLVPKVVLDERSDAVELARPILLSYHPALRARVLRHLLRRFGSAPGRAGTRVALEFTKSGASGGRIEIAGGVLLEREFDRLRIRRASADPAVERRLVIPSAEPGTGEAVIGGRRVRVAWRRAAPAGTASATGVLLNEEELVYPLEMRGWRPGDRIRLPYGTKKLKKLFAEARIGGLDRGRAPVLTDGAGRVLWVPGVARAVIAAPVSGTRAVHIEVCDER